MRAGCRRATSCSRCVYGFATTVGYVFPVLLGALATTGEFRHETLTPTFLATPRRGLVLLAKVKVAIIVGAVFGLVAWITTLAAGAGAFSVFGIESQLGDPTSGRWPAAASWRWHSGRPSASASAPS